MKIDIITIFPGMFKPVLGESIIKRAQKKGIVSIELHDLRDYTTDNHKSVDDRPFGGGAGMVLKVEPIHKALNDILGTKIRGRKNTKIILLSPQGEKMDQRAAKKLSALHRLVLICGHYEGIDERVREYFCDGEISIGDYVLTCGELPAMLLVDCVARLIPGVLGDSRSCADESFENNMLEYPQYTRPATYKEMSVPGVLLSGNHKNINEWRKKQALLKTRRVRPDLLRRA